LAHLTGTFIVSIPKPAVPWEIADDILYFGCDDFNIYGVRTSDGKEVFRFRTGYYVNANPTIRDGIMYILSSDRHFYAIDTKTAKEKWRFTTDNDNSGTKAELFDDKLVFGSSDENFYCLDRKTGKEIWRFRTSGGIWSNPLLDGDRIYFGSYDCRLYCLNLQGKLIWEFKTSNLTQNKFDLEEESVIEFKPPEVEETKEDEKDRYAVVTQTTESDTYKVESEYVFKSEYKQESQYK
jgi:outer membrane protein assembly factor BamB